MNQTITSNELATLKQAINFMKEYITANDYNINNPTYNNNYSYRPAFTNDYKSINLFTKKLISNKVIDKNIIIADQLQEMFFDMFGINIRDFDSLTSRKYLKFIYNNETDYSINKIKVVIRAYETYLTRKQLAFKDWIRIK